MKTKVILAVISPFRAHLYDFSSLRLPTPDLGIELILICDEKTLEDVIPPALYAISHKVSLVNYTETVRYLSLSEIEKIIEAQLALGKQVAVHSEEEMFLDDVARLNAKFELDGLTLAETQKFRNKYIMKEELKKAGVAPSYCLPGFTLVKPGDSFTSQLTYPVIVKPLNLAGTIGVKKCVNENELSSLLASQTAEVICEEYITGDLYHCDALVIDGKVSFAVCGKYFVPMDIATIEESFIGSEVVLNEAVSNRLCNATQDIITALNTPDGVIHAEFLLNESGLYFVEVGKRPAGAWISQMYEFAYKINLFNLHLECQYLKSEDFTKPFLKNKYCAGIHLLLPTSGILAQVEIACNISDKVRLNKMDSKLGQFQHKTYSMLDAIAEIIIFSNDKMEFSLIIKDLTSNSLIVVN